MASILSNNETVLKSGDKFLDPFYILEVNSVDYNESEIVSLINTENIAPLYSLTRDFNIDDWYHLLKPPAKFLLYNDELKNYILRYVWNICYNLIYTRYYSIPLKYHVIRYGYYMANGKYKDNYKLLLYMKNTDNPHIVVSFTGINNINKDNNL